MKRRTVETYRWSSYERLHLSLGCFEARWRILSRASSANRLNRGLYLDAMLRARLRKALSGSFMTSQGKIWSLTEFKPIHLAGPALDC